MPTPEPFPDYSQTDPANQTAFDAFCASWNSYIGNDNPSLALTAEEAVGWQPDAYDPEGAQVLGIRLAEEDLHVTLLNGEVIKAEVYTLTGDWSEDAVDARIWGACWKAMVASVNNNRDRLDFLSLLSDIEEDMPAPIDQSETVHSPVVSADGWSYRSASFERGPGLEYDKRVRACMDEYADWLEWY